MLVGVESFNPTLSQLAPLAATALQTKVISPVPLLPIPYSSFFLLETSQARLKKSNIRPPLNIQY